MADNPTNVRMGYAGAVYIGEVGATAPVDPETAWDADDWTRLGLISEDGITEQSSQETAEVRAWGYRAAPVRTQVTSEEFSFQLTFLETNVQILSIFFGIPLDDFTSTAASGGHAQFLKVIKGMDDKPQYRALGIDVIDGDYLTRIVVPRAQLTERGDLSYKTDEPVGYQMTFRGLIGSDGTSWTRMWTNVAAAA